jgi:hypothetical protein
MHMFVDRVGVRGANSSHPVCEHDRLCWCGGLHIIIIIITTTTTTTTMIMMITMDATHA